MFVPIGDNVERRTFPTFTCVLVFIHFFAFATQIRILVHNPDNLQPTISFIHDWGLVPSDLAEGRYIGALTHMFLHVGLAHFLGNMFCLWAFACSLEVGVGAAYLAAFYLVWGVAGGLLHAFMHWGADVPLVGASGAIAGLMGAYTVLYGPDTKIKSVLFIGWKPFVFSVPAMIYCGGWFALQVISARYDMQSEGGVAWYAHIGGFVVGAVTALIVRSELPYEIVRERDDTIRFRPRGYDPNAGKVVIGGYAYQLAENDVAGDGSTLPEACPYCGKVLDDEARITPGVARCRNGSCARFVYAGAYFA